MSYPEEEIPISSIFQAIFEFHTLEDVISKKVVFALKPEANLSMCMHVFEDKKIMSVPVYETGEYDDTRCLASIDLLDLVHYVNGLSLIQQAQMAQMKLVDCFEWDQLNKDLSVPIEEPIFKVMRYFSRGTYRVLASEELQSCGICSQMDLAKYLHQLFSNPYLLHRHPSASDPKQSQRLHRHRNALTAVGNMRIEEAGFGQSPFSTISGQVTVYDAIAELVKDGTRCLAVVNDSTGRLLGQFSARDLRGIGPHTFYRLHGRLGEYLEKYSPTSLKPAIVDMEYTVSETTGLFAEWGLHEAWVVDSQFRPVRVVTLADLMSLAALKEDMKVKAIRLHTPRLSQWSTITSPRRREILDFGEAPTERIVEEGEEDEDEDEDEEDEDLDEDEEEDEDEYGEEYGEYGEEQDQEFEPEPLYEDDEDDEGDEGEEFIDNAGRGKPPRLALGEEEAEEEAFNQLINTPVKEMGASTPRDLQKAVWNLDLEEEGEDEEEEEEEEPVIPQSAELARPDEYQLSYVLLQTVATMGAEGELSLVQKGNLKNMIVAQDPTVLETAEYHIARDDVEGLKDALYQLSFA